MRRQVWRPLLLLLVGLWLVSLPRDSLAQQTCYAAGKAWRVIDYQELTVDNLTAVAIDTSKLPQGESNVAMAYVSVEDATIRIRFTGSPTQTSGHEIAAGGSTVLCGRLIIEGFHAIRTSTGSGNAMLRVTLFDTYY